MDATREQLLSAMGFSSKAISILDRSLNMHEMADPTVKKQHQGSCGDILILSLKIDKHVIRDAAFEYIGCAGLQACASALTELVKEMPVTDAGKLQVKDILDYLQGIPQQKYECAEICIDTLNLALDDVNHQQN